MGVRGLHWGAEDRVTQDRSTQGSTGAGSFGRRWDTQRNRLRSLNGGSAMQVQRHSRLVQSNEAGLTAGLSCLLTTKGCEAVQQTVTSEAICAETKFTLQACDC